MPTRPGYVWSGTEWIAIGQEAAVSPFKYQATEPSSPATGDIWIDSDDEVPGIASALNYRWRKIAAGGETSLSGNDTSGLPLAYNPGYEQVYLNGVLQYRGSDYVATTGNTITGLTALVANDTIEVLSFVTAPIGDTYTQAAADGKFATTANFPAGAWTSYTPVLTAGSGSITSYTVNQAKYVQLGKTVHLHFRITITNNGTGAGALLATLPINALTTGYSGVGREDAISGNMIVGLVKSTLSTVTLFTYNNSYPGGTSAQINFSMTYEAA